jgi:hypothetical protein
MLYLTNVHHRSGVLAARLAPGHAEQHVGAAPDSSYHRAACYEWTLTVRKF